MRRFQFTAADPSFLSYRPGGSPAPPIPPADSHLILDPVGGVTLDVLNPTGTQDYSAQDPPITSASAINCVGITYLELSFNGIGSIDCSGCTGMTQLSMSDNALTSVDISGCSLLDSLYLDSNLLTTIDISGKPLLLSVTLHLNTLNQAAVDHVLTTLDSNGLSAGYLQLYGAGMAVPSITGQAAKTNLLGKLWTLATE